MKIIPSCEKCLYDRQVERIKNVSDNYIKEKYLKEIKSALDNRAETDTAPYMIYVFGKIYEKYFGKANSYSEIKKQYNSLVLSMEQAIEDKINLSADPLETALIYARIGNYIDFGALDNVEKNTFLDLLDNKNEARLDKDIYDLFIEKCTNANTFLLLADNCGEIVLDKLFIRQLKKRFPNLKVFVMVRGEEALNDATIEDAIYCNINKEANIISNGNGVAGTVYELLSKEAKEVFENADVILAKGQGNYESMMDCGREAFYSFLCKCDLFIKRFEVSKYTGMFIYHY